MRVKEQFCECHVGCRSCHLEKLLIFVMHSHAYSRHKYDSLIENIAVEER